MKIVCIADTHSYHEGLKMPEGDLLIFAGDMCGHASEGDIHEFNSWLATLPYKHKIAIAGNHCWPFVWHPEDSVAALSEAIYLQDSGTEIEGLKIYGTPWQPAFNNWAFNLPRIGPFLREKWAMIPSDTDILISHGPPVGILDTTHEEGELLGCSYLYTEVTERIRPKLHVFGHIHGGYGIETKEGITFVNASVLDEEYNLVNKPIVVEI
jgi:predicted phosphohydrolase